MKMNTVRVTRAVQQVDSTLFLTPAEERALLDGLDDALHIVGYHPAGKQDLGHVSRVTVITDRGQSWTFEVQVAE
jgi:hypothetical protein